MTPAILETALYVADLDAARAFYRDVLGLEVIAEVENRHVFFRCSGSVLLIFNPVETAKPAGNPAIQVPSHGAIGPGHACFKATEDELGLWEARLIAANVEVEARVTWPGGAKSIYFRDPAGNSLEFAEPKLWNLT